MKNRKFEFGGQNRKISKIRDNRFIKRSILHRLAFRDCVLLQTKLSWQPSNICCFLPKMAKQDVPKTPFSQKKISTGFSKILVADVNLMLEKVLTVSRRYLLPFLSYLENSAGGAIFAPPSGARVNVP